LPIATLHAIIIPVEPETRQRLLALNRSFYERFARPFADSRSIAQAGLTRALAVIPDGTCVLDVGCGDGRAARALEQQGRRLSYLGLDASPALISLARERASALSGVAARFLVADVTQTDWSLALEGHTFDYLLALALLHHIPGYDLRLRLVQQMARLLRPSGVLIASTWQFLNDERLRRKMVPWQAIGIDESQVEPGDYLLDWRRGGYGLRYCHLLGEAEMRSLCEEAGLSLKETFLADDNLSLYAIATRPPG
jgi:SAM-dependent methyltransferase